MDALRASTIVSSKLVTPKNVSLKNFIIWHDKLMSWQLFYGTMIYLIVALN